MKQQEKTSKRTALVSARATHATTSLKEHSASSVGSSGTRSASTGAALEMPLLDAVHTLVEKERALMDLKVSEAADEVAA
eukprot:CAMPEP_0172626618 /NCGR_PEP_ID=MMETSP1068-20121228/151376_1 /TAXON_ID=35684 /ORGANISM="Pseudopedinella elastica, Strain CCMP716" /LENGTH=79 /DNA_ID=CAMNT_0013436285 /DNA_START=26 /DNA_END=261 /DNA_ORIENTATION=-